jgi:hypothetical protein
LLDVLAVDMFSKLVIPEFSHVEDALLLSHATILNVHDVGRNFRSNVSIVMK